MAISNDMGNTGLNKSNFNEILNNIGPSIGIQGRKITIGEGNTQKTVSFNEVYKALGQIAQSDLNKLEKENLFKKIISLREKDITSNKGWFLGKYIAKISGKILSPSFNKEREISIIMNTTNNLSLQLLKSAAEFIANHDPRFEKTTENFLEEINRGSGNCPDTIYPSITQKTRNKDSIIKDWLELCNEAIKNSPSPLQKKTIITAATYLFFQFTYPLNKPTANWEWNQFASNELKTAFTKHIIITDIGYDKISIIYNE